MTIFDSDRPGYSAERIYEAADFAVKERKENPPARFPCDLGCGADFSSPFEREVHIICDHEGDAA